MSVPEEKMDVEKSNQKNEKQAQFNKTKTGAARPTAKVYDINGKATKASVKIPDVCLTPIRQDIVQFVHTNMNKNSRQPYAVKCGWGPKGIVAGMQVAAKSWGTGRAVARIPRVKGGGTHRAGQGAYGNMCRGGRMFAPTKTWRKWHRKINVNQKRYAVCSALAGSCIPGLVMARGHRIQKVNEIPLVIESEFNSITKTKNALKVLKLLNLDSELKRCKKRYQRAGKGKMRNRRFKRRTGPLVVYKESHGIVKSLRNIPGVDFCNVDKLNLLKLAPGGHIGRLIIWTKDAFEMLPLLYGTLNQRSLLKKRYKMPQAIMTNSDLNRIINSVQIQSALRPKKSKIHLFVKNQKIRKVDPYKSKLTRPPVPKRAKISIPMTENEKKDMKKYWVNVFGEKSIYKTREILADEKRRVKEAIKRAEREKKGLDLE